MRMYGIFVAGLRSIFSSVRAGHAGSRKFLRGAVALQLPLSPFSCCNRMNSMSFLMMQRRQNRVLAAMTRITGIYFLSNWLSSFFFYLLNLAFAKKNERSNVFVPEAEKLCIACKIAYGNKMLGGVSTSSWHQSETMSSWASWGLEWGGVTVRDTTRQPSHEGSRRSIRMLKLLACTIFGIGPHFYTALSPYKRG